MPISADQYRALVAKEQPPVDDTEGPTGYDRTLASQPVLVERQAPQGATPEQQRADLYGSLTADAYRARVADEARIDADRAVAVTTYPIRIEPDAAAAAMKTATQFSQEFGTPVPPTPLVHNEHALFTDMLAARKARNYLADQPMLAQWMLDKPDMARVATDSLQDLGWWETTAKSLANSAYKGAVSNTALAYHAWLQGEAQTRASDAGKTLSQIMAEYQAPEQRYNPLGPAQALRRYFMSRLSEVGGLDDPAFSRYHLEEMQRIQRDRDSIPTAPAAQRGAERWAEVTKAGDLASTLGAAARAFRDSPYDMTAYFLNVVAENVPIMAAAAAVTAATRQPSAGLAIIGGNSAAVSGSSDVMEQIRDAGYDLNKSEDVTRLLADPEILKRMRDRSFAYGTVVGALDAFSGGVAGKVLASSHVGNMVLQMLTQGLMGGSGEALGKLASGRPINWGDVLAEGIAEVAGAPMEVLTLGGSAALAARKRALAAETRRDFFKELTAQAANSKVRARMPQAFQDFLERATADGPIETIYVPAEAFQEFFQAQGVDIDTAAKSLGLPLEKVHDAIANNMDVEIPTATYAAKVAGDAKADSFFAENMRFRPGELTAREAATLADRAEEALRDAADLTKTTTEQMKDLPEQIVDQMAERLAAAGRAPSVARQEARVYGAFYRSLADRTGVPVETILQRFPLPEVRGAELDAVRKAGLTVDAPQSTTADVLAAVRATRSGETATLPPGVSALALGDIADALDALGIDTSAPDADVLAAIQAAAGTPEGAQLSQALDAAGVAAPRQPSEAAPPAAEASGGAPAGAGLPADVAEPVTSAAEFLANPREALRRPGYAIITALREASPDTAADDLARMRAELKGDVVEVSGAYKGVDQGLSYLVFMPLDEVRALADRYGQESILTSDGLVYTDGRLTPANHDQDIVGPEAKQLDFYSTAEGIGPFAVGLDFEATVPPRAERAGVQPQPGEDGLIPLSHRSGRRLTVIDPSFAGSGPVRGAERSRGGPAKSYYGIDIGRPGGYTPEFGLGDEEHTVRLAPGELYNWYEDASGLKAQIDPALSPSAQVAAYEQLIKDAGYPGYWIDKGPLGRTAALFVAAEPSEPGVASKLDRYRADYVVPVNLEAAGREAATRARADALRGEIERVAQRIGEETAYTIGTRLIVGGDAIPLRGSAAVRAEEIVDELTRRARRGEPLDEVAVERENGNVQAFPIGRGQALNQTAYHGTPYTFDRFSLGAIGTGEGAQAFGWGLYFAGDREVAELYRDRLSGNYVTNPDTGAKLTIARAERVVTRKIRDIAGVDENIARLFAGRSRGSTSEYPKTDWYMQKWTADITGRAWDASDQAAWDTAIAVWDTFPLVDQGRLYEVDIPEADTMLDWDKPLSDQPKVVQDALSALGAGYDWGAQRAYDDALAAALSSDSSPSSLPPEPPNPPGRAAYRSLSARLGGDREASLALHELGVQGIRYLDGNSRRAGEGTHNFVVFSDAAVKILSLEQQASDSLRGRIVVAGQDGAAATIELFKRANLSTMLHETGHFFLDTLSRLSPEDAGLNADMIAVRSWWRDNAEAVAADGNLAAPAARPVTAADVQAWIDGGTTGDAAVDNAVYVGAHEQFARGFEAYLMEGRAPSVGLRGAFESFKAWLVSVYRDIARLGVQLDPGIRRVFDRLLASDDAIAAARKDMFDGTLFDAMSAEQLGVRPEDAARVLAAHRRSIEAAHAELLREIMEPIRAAREDAYKDERERVSADVARDVNARPVYRLLEWLGNRRWLDGERPADVADDLRMDRAALVAEIGEDAVKALPRGRFTIYTPGGADPQTVASMFGFTSVDGMVKALRAAPRRVEAIETEVERVMAERHPDPVTDGSIAAAAVNAMHTTSRADFLAAELDILRKATGSTLRPSLTSAQAAEVARRQMGRTTVRDAVNLERYIAAERRAAVEAQQALAGGDRIKAMHAKRRQLIAHALYAEAKKVSTERDRLIAKAKQLSKKSSRARLAPDYLAAVDDVLDTYVLRDTTAASDARRGGLRAYVENMIAAGRENELAIPDKVLDEAGRVPLNTLTVDDMRAVRDTLANLEHTARLKKKLLDAKRERDLDVVVDRIVGNLAANIRGSRRSRTGTWAEAAQRRAREFLNLTKSATTLLREIDGTEITDRPADEGAYADIKGGVDEAMANLAKRRGEAATELEKLFGVYTTKERRAMSNRIDVPEISDAMSKWDMISVALNTGNADNLQRLTDKKVGGSFTVDQLAAILDRLDKRDWDFVQSVWDYIDTLWPEIAARERRKTGTTPLKVEAAELQTKFGTYRGGYYPLRYDPELSATVADETNADIMANMQAGRFGKAQTRHGHLKERAKSSGRPVLIDIGVLPAHINQVLHDLALSEEVSNVWRILQHPDLKAAFIDVGRQVDHAMLEAWIQDVASGEVRSSNVVARTARMLKSGYTVSKLAFNLSTALLQVSGVGQSVVVTGKKAFALGVSDYIRRDPRAVAADVTARSTFMAERETTFNKDIYDMMGDLAQGPTKGAIKRFQAGFVNPYGFWLMQKVQFYAVDMPTWLAGYRTAVDSGATEAEAIAAGDDVVRRAQGSGLFSDRTAIERGTLGKDTRQNDVLRMFTALASYMFTKANIAMERTGHTNFRSPVQALHWAFDMALLYTFDVLVLNLVRGTLPGMSGGGDDKDSWLRFLARETALGIAGTVPFIRDGASALSGGSNAYGSIVDTFARPLQQTSQGQVDMALVRSWLNLAGLLTQFPSTATARVVEAATRDIQGDDIRVRDYIFGQHK